MLAVLRRVPLFVLLSDEQLQWIVAHADEVRCDPGDMLYTEGSPAECFYVLLEGEVQITKCIGVEEQETVLVTHHDGAFTGEVPLLAGTPYIASAHVLSQSHLLRMGADDFRMMLTTCPPVVSILLSALAERTHSMEASLQQRGKIVALGTLAAGLAHELNNPAAAVNRSAEDLRKTLQALQSVTLKLNEQHLTPSQLKYIADLLERVAEHATSQLRLDALEQSDQEELLTEWLDTHEVMEGWKLAPTFIRTGINIAQLEDSLTHLPANKLGHVLAWLEATLTIQELSDIIEEGSRRISALVKVVKEYTYMDQAPSQEIDVHEGLENTLIILDHKLKGGITVTREYDPALPRISAYGSELNQIWTNLIDNAIDAMGGHGKLVIRTSATSKHILVEIVDDGPGIPADVLPRIFEPFFTTKGVGAGTGLGLDISYRLVGKHHGDISASSQPGDTRFQVRLPINQS